MIYIGTAGWTIPTQAQDFFSSQGSHLERYARFFNCVEINSSFYREHKPDTYAKWRDATSADFRFSVKLSREFTHEHRLSDPRKQLKENLKAIGELKEKWACLLVQLPPSLRFDKKIASRFLALLRDSFAGNIILEPRHKSWTSDEAISLLAVHNINKVLADPEPCRLPKASRLKVEGTRYFRLHGSPQIYKSRYSKELIERMGTTYFREKVKTQNTWYIFDNTAYGFATQNAIELKEYFLTQQVPVLG